MDGAGLVDSGAVYYGGPGNDEAEWVGKGGVFYGAAGRDRITVALGGIFVGGRGWDDVFRVASGGRCCGNRGNDAVDRGGGIFDAGAMFPGSFFNGGPGTDFADICGVIGVNVTIKKVEQTADDCPPAALVPLPATESQRTKQGQTSPGEQRGLLTCVSHPVGGWSSHCG